MKHSSTRDHQRSYGWFSLAVLLLLTGAVVFFITRGKKPLQPPEPDPAFAAYVAGYTGGVISRNHPITVRLTRPALNPGQAGDPLGEGMLSFSPSLEGKAYWKDPRTVEFLPAAPMMPGQVYTGTLQLGRLLKVEAPAFEEFVFGFRVIPQHFELQAVGLHAAGEQGLEQYSFEGRILTADEAAPEEVEKMISASYAGKQRALQWKHDSKTVHTFLIKGLQRGKQEQALHLQWSGEAIGVAAKGEKYIPISARGDFKLLDARVEEGEEPAVHLFFSDPLDDRQALEGMVRIDTLQQMTRSIRGNELTVYPGMALSGPKEVSVFQGLRNISGKALPADVTLQLVFEGLKPAVKFISEGNILPSTDGMILPIEAVNLKSIQVRVIKIYQDKIGQFLQVNDLDGSNQLSRVGRPVLQKVIRLDNMGVQDLGRWNRFTLELSKLIAAEPGAIYQVAIGFGKQDVTVPCAGGDDENGLKKVNDPREQKDEEAFDNTSGYFYDDFARYYEADYDWRQRGNPCNSAYYTNGDNVIKKNILASDIGLIAKRGTDNSLLLIATNLLTAKPLSGVALNIYNYQLQKIATTITDNKGMAVLDMQEKAFLVEAENGQQRAYLKLADGTALSVSQFDVSGDLVQQGIKGFLYGERGVWRPGDSIYLSFLLEDKNKRLPARHPVVFELKDPRGMPVQRLVRSVSTNGLYSFATATDADAPTGNWTATVKVGGATFSKVVKVETVKPNRLKISLDFAGDRITPEHQAGNLQARWLSGATAAHLKASFEMILREAHTTFKGYQQYIFDDPAIRFKTVDRTIFEGPLDAEGHAVIHPGIRLDAHVPSSLRAFFKGKVYEPGGDFSVHYQTVPYYPYQKYIGIKVPEGSGYGNMLKPDKSYPVDVVTLDAEGRPVQSDSLLVEVFKARWRWWWEENDREGADFVRSNYDQRVMQRKIFVRNGRGSFPLRIAAPDWGRYYIRVSDPASGYTTGGFVYFEWPSNEGSALAAMPGGATRLAFTTDKESYAVGEKMQLYIPGSGKGTAFITVENGSHVFRTYEMEAKKGTNIFTIPVTADMSPNAYINVSAVQPHGQTVNDLPIRQYGITGIKVEDPGTILQPEILMPEKLRPQQQVSIRVKEHTGKPMAYTLAVVDQGLLDLTNYKTPDPHAAFYAREALGVQTWDVFDQVIGAYGARLERLLSIGGDGALIEKPAAQNLRFKPVVKFFGPCFLDAGESAVHTFKMPNYVGAVRVMAVAGYEGAYGSVEKSVQVKQPLMILSTLPRVAGPQEEISLPVNVFVMEKGVGEVTVMVSADKHFSINDASVQHFRFDRTGDTLLTFHLQANSLTGKGEIHVAASGGSYRSVNDINLSVRNPNPPQTKVLSKALQPGERWQPDIRLFGMDGSNAVQLEVAAVPPLNLGQRLAYLIAYPYGCVEQTVSSVFPQLYLDKLIPLSAEREKTIAANIKAGIHDLSGFQHASGGFSYWPGSNYPDDWATSYTGHFLLEARRKGYAVPEPMIRRWADYQARRANVWKPEHAHRDDLVQAYRLYTLALAQQPDWGAMNRLRALQPLGLQARWRLADAYAVAGQAPAAQELINGAGLQVAGYRSLAYTYGSNLRDEAMILQALLDIGDYSKGYNLARSISQTLNSGDWLSTQETAFSLVALTQFFSHSPGAAKVHYAYQLGSAAAIAQQTDLPESDIAIPVKGKTAPRLTLHNTAKGVLYANVVIRGTPAAGQEEAVQHDLRMTVQYVTYNGGRLDPATLPQGTDFIAEVTVSNPGTRGDYHNIALSQIFPSGWEIRNTRFEGTSGVYDLSTPDYQDIRDDRVYTYFDLKAGESKKFRILLSATYAGRYYLPAVQCAAMYDHSIIAVQPGGWVEVSKR